MNGALLTEFVFAFLATLGFGLLFQVPRRSLLICGLVGGMGRLVRSVAMLWGANLIGGSYIGALTIGMMGYFLARWQQTPRMTFTVTGVIPMIPGVPAFSALLAFTAGQMDTGLEQVIQTVLITGALAMGLTTIRVISRVQGELDGRF